MRHPVGFIVFGVLLCFMAIDGYLMFGLNDWTVWMCAALGLVLPIAGIYIWLRWFDGEFKMVFVLTIIVLLIFTAYYIIGPGHLGYTDNQKKWIAWTDAKMKASKEAKKLGPVVEDQYYWAKSAEIDLRILKDEAWAKSNLEIAIKSAQKNQVMGIGRFGFHVSPDVLRLLPAVNFGLDRYETLVIFDK